MVYNSDPAVNPRPEVELLLCCARTHLDSPRAVRARTLVRTRLDWDALFTVAARHSMLPLLYQHLDALCPDAVPKVRLAQLPHYLPRHGAV
jgi:hypothetical protein